jgi:hypothetical protein
MFSMPQVDGLGINLADVSDDERQVLNRGNESGAAEIECNVGAGKFFALSCETLEC